MYVTTSSPPAYCAPAPSAGAATEESTPPAAASAMFTECAYEYSVIREMGVPYDDMKQAMRAAFTNPDR